jgi:hypothetical protein
MKEHAKKLSTKPLKATKPGKVTVGELQNDVKKPLLVHVDVFSKIVNGVPLRDKTEEECTRGIMEVAAK